MAENESLDLGQLGGQRWRYVFDAVRKRKSSADIARQVELKLPKALKALSKVLREFVECGMDVARQAERNGYSWTKMIGPVGSDMEGVRRASA